MSSIHDVAKQAGVSTATVSRTFNEPELIHSVTRERVRAAARTLNYQPRRARQSEQRSKSSPRLSNAIGFQFFSTGPSDRLQSNNFYASVLAGAMAEASEFGLHILVHTTDGHGFAQELPRMVEERTVDGLLLVGTEDPVVLKELDRHVPEIVLVDHRDEDGKYEAILSDGFGGAYAATKSLLDRGHHRIGFFGNEPGVSSFQDRLRGYWCAHMEAGIQPDPYLTISARNKSENEKALKAYLASDLHPTAVVTSNDWYALMVIRVCRELNIRIPDDLSLIGFDDVAFATQIDPPLSTVSVNKEEMGRIAVRRLYSKICVRSQNSEPQPPVLSILPVQLKLRHTCRSLI